VKARSVDELVSRMAAGGYDEFPTATSLVPQAVWEMLRLHTSRDPEWRASSGGELAAAFDEACQEVLPEEDPDPSPSELEALEPSWPEVPVSKGRAGALVALVAGAALLVVALVGRPPGEPVVEPSATETAVPEKVARAHWALRELVTVLEEDEVIRDALAVQGAAASSELVATWRAGGERLREVLGAAAIDELVPAALGPARTSKSLSDAGEVYRIARLLQMHGLRDVPALADAPGVVVYRRELERVLRIRPAPSVPGRITHVERSRSLLEKLAGGGRRWEAARDLDKMLIRGPDGVPLIDPSYGAPDADPRLVTLSYDRMAFESTNERTLQGLRDLAGVADDWRGPAPDRVEFPLAGPPGEPVFLVVAASKWSGRVAVLTLEGEALATSVAFEFPAPPGGEARGAESQVEVYLGVVAPADLGPLRRARIEGFGIQVIGDPKQVVEVGAVARLAAGPPPPGFEGWPP
jgi:hypothetical protein